MQTIKRRGHLVNLDPAAEYFEVSPSIDIKDLITLQDVMEELGYGPNGGLIYCLEYLLEQKDWFEEQIESFEEDYLLIDCPGQIELYTHFNIMRSFVDLLRKQGYTICGVYCMDSQFMDDTSKFFAGVLAAMSAMIQLEIPHINVMTKMDLVMSEFLIDGEDDSGEDYAFSGEGLVHYPRKFERFFNVDPTLLLEDANEQSRPKFAGLNRALVSLVDEFSMVSFLPLNIRDENSLSIILQHLDHAMQYGEDLEPEEPRYDQNDV